MKKHRINAFRYSITLCSNKQQTIVTKIKCADKTYFKGMNFEEWVAPIPGRLCFTGWQYQGGCASRAGKSTKIHPSSDQSSQPWSQRCWNSSRCKHQQQNQSSQEQLSCYEDESSQAEDAHSQECSPSKHSFHSILHIQQCAVSLSEPEAFS